MCLQHADTNGIITLEHLHWVPTSPVYLSSTSCSQVLLHPVMEPLWHLNCHTLTDRQTHTPPVSHCFHCLECRKEPLLKVLRALQTSPQYPHPQASCSFCSLELYFILHRLLGKTAQHLSVQVPMDQGAWFHWTHSPLEQNLSFSPLPCPGAQHMTVT